MLLIVRNTTVKKLSMRKFDCYVIENFSDPRTCIYIRIVSNNNNNNKKRQDRLSNDRFRF